MDNKVKFLTEAVKASKQSGKVLKAGFVAKQEVREKGKHDVVSQIDLASEKIILKIISKSFPSHSIRAEESGSQNKRSEYKWYIDPLDGTSNFLSGVAYFSVSIALAFREKIILGVVYNPILDELYTAEVNKGTFLNGKKIRVSKEKDFSKAFVAAAYSSSEQNIHLGLKTVEKLSLASRRVMINFSPALDLCNIARGRLDALADSGTTPEDHAAGSLIVEEAGGKINNYKYKNWDVEKVGIVASNGLLQAKLKSSIK